METRSSAELKTFIASTKMKVKAVYTFSNFQSDSTQMITTSTTLMNSLLVTMNIAQFFNLSYLILITVSQLFWMTTTTELVNLEVYLTWTCSLTQRHLKMQLKELSTFHSLLRQTLSRRPTMSSSNRSTTVTSIHRSLTLIMTRLNITDLTKTPVSNCLRTNNQPMKCSGDRTQIDAAS